MPSNAAALDNMFVRELRISVLSSFPLQPSLDSLSGRVPRLPCEGAGTIAEERGLHIWLYGARVRSPQ